MFAAAQTVQHGGTIEIADGHYMMPTVFTMRTDDVCIRSASGDRDAVVLDGAQSDHGELMGFTECHRVTVANLTIQNCIHNCVARNIWQRGLKGVCGPQAEGADDLPMRPSKRGKPKPVPTPSVGRFGRRFRAESDQVRCSRMGPCCNRS